MMKKDDGGMKSKAQGGKDDGGMKSKAKGGKDD